MVAYNARKLLDDGYLIVIGAAYGCLAVVQFLHALSYKGLELFAGYTSNLPTQLWLVGRYLQSFALLAAPFFRGKRIDMRRTIAAFAVPTGVLAGLVFAGAFPDAFVEGQGLTPFNVDRTVLGLVARSIGTTIAAEIAFTLYTDPFGLPNLVGQPRPPR